MTPRNYSVRLFAKCLVNREINCVVGKDNIKADGQRAVTLVHVVLERDRSKPTPHGIFRENVLNDPSHFEDGGHIYTFYCCL
jgi:hypothetical protein